MTHLNRSTLPAGHLIGASVPETTGIIHFGLGIGTLDYCRLHEITIQAWSPLQAGFFTGPSLGNPGYPELNAVVNRLAGPYGVPPEAIATAWITRHPARMQVVLGTTNPERLTAAAQGADVVLTKPEWYELYRAAGHLIP
jgi:predicted oxidoreductase